MNTETNDVRADFALDIAQTTELIAQLLANTWRASSARTTIASVADLYSAAAGGASLRVIADGLTRDGIVTAQGGRSRHASTVRKVLGGQQAQSIATGGIRDSSG